MMMMMSQVGQAPAARLSGLVTRDLPNGTVLSYEGVEREVELLDETHNILLSNLTCADSGVYSCQLSAPVGQQNRDGEIQLILTGKRHSSGHSVVGLSSELSQFLHGKHLTYQWNTHRHTRDFWFEPGNIQTLTRFCRCLSVMWVQSSESSMKHSCVLNNPTQNPLQKEKKVFRLKYKNPFPLAKSPTDTRWGQAAVGRCKLTPSHPGQLTLQYFRVFITSAEKTSHHDLVFADWFVFKLLS